MKLTFVFPRLQSLKKEANFYLDFIENTYMLKSRHVLKYLTELGPMLMTFLYTEKLLLVQS